ncbi:MAG TPA: HIT family protein [Alphaproteobacteria bacterium]|nr:HIT family protein [Alphaproteobacteria bacterium]
MTDFVLHPRLAADTLPVIDLPLCRLLLMNDSRFPWLILVPRLAGAREVVDLSPANRLMLAEETDLAAALLRDRVPTDKLNIAAIGNIVEQLHVHIVARRKDDAAWPGVVWGHGSAQPYSPETAAARLADLQNALAPP